MPVAEHRLTDRGYQVTGYFAFNQRSVIPIFWHFTIAATKTIGVIVDWAPGISGCAIRPSSMERIDDHGDPRQG